MQCRSDVLSTTSSRWLLFRNNIISPVKSLYFCFSYMQARQLRYQQGAKKIIFTACHSGKLRLAFTSPDVISTSPKNFLTSRIDLKVLLLFEFLKKNITCPSGKLKTEFTSPIAKSTGPGLSDTTFFARCTGVLPYSSPLFPSVGQLVEEHLNTGVPSIEVTNTKIMRTFFGVPLMEVSFE